MRASRDRSCLTALWLVGVEDTSPHDSGEICVAELFGRVIGPDRSQVRLGVKAHSDPRLRTEMLDIALDIDAGEEHDYAAEWDASGVRFSVDGALVHTSPQTLDYPLQLMIDLFEFPAGSTRDPAQYPKAAYVRSVRGFE